MSLNITAILAAVDAADSTPEAKMFALANALRRPTDPDNEASEVETLMRAHSSALATALEVGVQLPFPSISNLPPVVDSTPYEILFAGSGGVGPYTFDLAEESDPLPDGLTLASDGTLSGTPSGLTGATVRIRVTDADASVGTQDYVIPDTPAVIITPIIGVPPSGTVGAFYSIGLASIQNRSVGNRVPVTWALDESSDPLPDGLSIQVSESGQATLSGTPTEAADGADVVLRCTATSELPEPEGGWPYGLCDFLLSIDEAAAPDHVDILTPSLPSATLGIAYSQTLSAAGGTAPYAWALDETSDPLPDGLALDPDTGVIAGTPSSTGTANLVVNATSSDSLVGVHALTLVTGTATLVPKAPRLPNAVNSRAYSQLLTATGGVGPYVWARNVDSDALPTGLAIAPGGTLNGTPDDAAGTYGLIFDCTDAAGNIAQLAMQLTVTPQQVDHFADLFNSLVTTVGGEVIGAEVGIPATNQDLVAIEAFAATIAATPTGVLVIEGRNVMGTGSWTTLTTITLSIDGYQPGTFGASLVPLGGGIRARCTLSGALGQARVVANLVTTGDNV